MRALVESVDEGTGSNFDREVFTETEVCRRYRLSVPWLRRARLERRGPQYLKIGRMVRYRRQDVEEYLAQYAVETTEATGRAG
jgi:predicted DNA-binding transcriptional regulator AlpA